jgi:hypothetical protein
MECGALHHDNKLGSSPMAFFNAHGFGYGAQPAPHRRVDESTSPDQWLRVYWTVDEDTRIWQITSIGTHAWSASRAACRSPRRPG